ncbi:metallophosphoesterase [Sinorhizobium phage phiM7]|uniref:Metallophosphoesterase n=2 Tax=Emdodecavirus TaxID=1980937 RepID=A0A0F6SIN6_9CAUD|nr:metallo-phosphoesterase [Sinorhizobium phage phiM12]YP_009601348.1 metallo-phosphoesterase [Sinorhizobium phage phiM7]AGR47928.1 putative metallophosphatase [Sinorhizobium phage phiM12]AKF12768.1 metallophosphoesterase [Sinorhizobium phage phiM7]AKF13129.1 metallophosphoesterase [Sinorhizobium phage phiM19]
MTKIRLIGDLHGDMNAYLNIISDCDRSIQVGDFGIGFIRSLPVVDPNKHEFIRGNHDDPSACKRQAAYIPDGTIRNDVMFVGGAYSIDWAYRTPGLSWWDDEECSPEQLESFIEKYIEAKPRVMITHETPDCVADVMCSDMNWKKYPLPSRTRDAFDVMFKAHKPKLWVAGHWHLPWQKHVHGTHFVVLNINEYIDVDLDI